MALLARTSRRTALGMCAAALLMLAAVVVVKDLNDKLAVMANSNAGYQRMTDSQADKIKKLQVSNELSIQCLKQKPG